jgi:hypothetical protein
VGREKKLDKAERTQNLHGAAVVPHELFICCSPSGQWASNKFDGHRGAIGIKLGNGSMHEGRFATPVKLQHANEHPARHMVSLSLDKQLVHAP